MVNLSGFKGGDNPLAGVQGDGPLHKTKIKTMFWLPHLSKMKISKTFTLLPEPTKTTQPVRTCLYLFIPVRTCSSCPPPQTQQVLLEPIDNRVHTSILHDSPIAILLNRNFSLTGCIIEID